MRVSLWRFLLTLSLLLTLPMQGYAAARMASCDPVLANALSAVNARATLRLALVPELPMHHGSSGHASVLQPSSGAGHHAVHDATAYGSSGLAGGMHDGEQHDGMPHHGMQGGADDGTHGGAPQGTHDDSQGGGHTAHGASCMSCTPCSPGAPLACSVPITTASVSTRVVPALLVAPASPDLAHPERPPQAFLA